MKLPPPVSLEMIHCPIGKFPGVCSRIIDLGTQPTKFGPKRKIYLEWQIPSQLDENGLPQCVGERFTFSRDTRSHLIKLLSSWRGKEFTNVDLENFVVETILGKPGVVEVDHDVRDGRVWPKVVNVTRMPSNDPKPELLGSTFFFSLMPDEFCANQLDDIEDYFVRLIKESPEYKQLSVDENAYADSQVDETYDDIAF